MRYLLTFDDDDDFSLKFRGEFINEGLLFDTVDELREIEITGAYGSPRTENTKCHCIEKWLREACDELGEFPIWKGGGNHSLRITKAPVTTDNEVERLKRELTILHKEHYELVVEYDDMRARACDQCASNMTFED